MLFRFISTDTSTFDNAFIGLEVDTLMDDEQVDIEETIRQLKALITYFKKKNGLNDEEDKIIKDDFTY